MPSSAAAQQFLAIDTIHEDIIVLKEGGFRVVLMCSSLNFALKSAEEQEATIYQYQNFLNSLDFPLQIVVHSRKLNTAPYLESLKERQRSEDNELLKIQITEYMEFIKTFASITNIMSKTFYVVVPFTPAIIEKGGGILGGLLSSVGLGAKKPKAGEILNESFQEYKNQLWQRVNAVTEGFRSFGIRAIPLNTEELTELFYELYNPTEFEKMVAGAPEDAQQF